MGVEAGAVENVVALELHPKVVRLAGNRGARRTRSAAIAPIRAVHCFVVAE